MQTDEAVSQAGHKVLVVVSRAQHQVAVDGQDTQGVQQGHLLGHGLVGSAELVEHGAVQTVVDRVEGEALGAPFGLERRRETLEQNLRGARRRAVTRTCPISCTMKSTTSLESLLNTPCHSLSTTRWLK